MPSLLPELHIISNGTQSMETVLNIFSEIHPFAHALHIREKKWSALDMGLVIEGLIQSGVPSAKIYINDRVDIARAYQVGGIQLGERSLRPQQIKAWSANMRIGRSIHEVRAAQDAKIQGADYAMFGHIFPTESKHNLHSRGILELQSVCRSTDIPIIALGGMTPDRVHMVVEAGANGIAIMSGVMSASDPQRAVKAFLHALQEAFSSNSVT
ncbi:thiazole tautomerase (transcriptional regulator TenI) [Paenibacillus shirakamiensis]|uniref:Thiazole tautomerase (Transcriptional regulator TenI) n=1 Tax=Paenibacillus shirakamiensis TaxID=1265935 RepID=A0ABS4JDL4_9BACL|nr:thiamine phosphate synthase [Paenibacillus shirakamiensis]MBP1999806.1 thiazole tautomerase (transcriptional regulator TenI) [Paenibacillus shirakamiensis]